MGSFMTGSHHLLTDDDVSVAALWRRANRQSTLPGEVSATLSSPAAHPPSNRFSAGGYDPSWVAMAGVPVVMTPLSQKHAMARPEGLSLKGCGGKSDLLTSTCLCMCGCLRGLIPMPGHY